MEWRTYQGHVGEWRRMSQGIPGCPKVKMGTAGDYFKSRADREEFRYLPKWVEMYLEYHRNLYFDGKE